MDFWIALFLNGLVVGAVYSLLGVSMSLVYGALKMVDLLRGDLAIAAAYIAYYLSTANGLTLWAAALIASLLGGVLGLLVERLAYRPLRGQAAYAPLLSTLGLSLAIQGLLQLAFGSELRSFPEASALKAATYNVGPFQLSKLELSLLVGLAILAIALKILIERTNVGRGVRALAENEEVAAACGVSPPFIFGLTFFLATIVSTFAGVGVGLLYDLEPAAGLPLTIRGFIVSVLAGSSGTGAVVGAGLLLGCAESLISGFLPLMYRDTFVFCLLFCLLLWRPGGISFKETRRYA